MCLVSLGGFKADVRLCIFNDLHYDSIGQLHTRAVLITTLFEVFANVLPR